MAIDQYPLFKIALLNKQSHTGMPAYITSSWLVHYSKDNEFVG